MPVLDITTAKRYLRCPLFTTKLNVNLKINKNIYKKYIYLVCWLYHVTKIYLQLKNPLHCRHLCIRLYMFRFPLGNFKMFQNKFIRQ